MATFIEELVQLGREEGLAVGERQGRASLTRRQLRKRLGALPESLDETIALLGVDQLEELVEALLDFQTIHDLEAWLRQQPPAHDDGSQ